MRFCSISSICALWAVLALTSPGVGVRAADWPMDRGDASRSGYTAEALPPNLSLRWNAVERHPPAPAWPRIDRMPFDFSPKLVVAGGTVFYGTSTEGKVVAREAATGAVRWTFFTDAPVRFAPAVWQDRVLVPSDDGYLYCLGVADGKLHWKFRGGPCDEMLLGNDRMASRWPIRGGPAVVDGVVYFGAGIWPTEGVYLHAVDIATGKALWTNDSSGAIEMDQPHPTARAKSGAAFQGAIVAHGDLLLTPTGRGVPAAFDRTTGEFRYFHLQANRGIGGSEVAAIDSHFFSGGTMFASASGEMELTLGKPISFPGGTVVHGSTRQIQVAAHPRWIVFSTGDQVVALDRKAPSVVKQAVGPKGEPVRRRVLGQQGWVILAGSDHVDALVVAQDTALVGEKDGILALDAATGETTWKAQVQGSVHSIAVADGRLYASTDQGLIYCFGPGDAVPVALVPEPVRLPPADTAYAAAAEAIVSRTGVTEGYCLDVACGEGQLALELARRTKLQIYAVDADPAKVEAARRMLEAAGLYGVRVTVHHADPSAIAYPDFFADLVVSGRSVLEGAESAPREAAARMQRPFGGIACYGPAEAIQIHSRGPLEGTGQWTHLYADPANTLCSSDDRLHGTLEMLWYRDTDLAMPSRHGRGPAPLVAEGRMFVEGLDAVRATNIYNGATLWEFALPKILSAYHQDHLTGVAGTGSNLCLGDRQLYLHTGDKCLVLDPQTGRQIAQWSPPPRADGQPGTWGYIACNDSLLFGTLVNAEHLVKESWRSFLGKLDMTRLYTESDTLFALDAATGKLAWRFDAEHSIRHNAIALGSGRVYLIDRPLAEGDTAVRRTGMKPTEPPAGRLLCLDSRTGNILWETRDDIFGTLLVLSEKHGVVLMTYQPTSFRLDSEVGGRMAAFQASDGRRLWSIAAKYKSRPVVNDDAIYAEPGKWNLLTGEPMPFEFSRSYGCGILAGSTGMLVFRSATLGYVDLETNSGTVNFGGIRPGCWVNAIPAGGLVLMGDAASWCTCSYLNQATIALKPRSD